MTTQHEDQSEEVIVGSGTEGSEVIESGEITAVQAKEQVTREKETARKFTARNPLKPEPIAVRPEPTPTEVLDGKLTNTLVEEEYEEEEKTVVLVKSYTKCYIGGTWYEFKAGHKYRITQTVKERLKKKGVLEVV